MDAKEKMKELKEGLTNKNTWIAVGIEFGIIFLFILVVSLFGTGVIVIGLLLVAFFLVATLIKEMLDDRDSRK